MVTNYPQSVEVHGSLGTGANHEEGFGGRVFDRLRQAVCGLHGHDTYVQFERDRMYLRCVTCGHETHGWELREARPAVAQRIEPRRATLVTPQLVSERKIA